MNLADKPCYPRLNHHESDGGEGIDYYGEEGLTFRERLVVALASNPALVDSNETMINHTQTALHIIRQADEIIGHLERGTK